MRFSRERETELLVGQRVLIENSDELNHRGSQLQNTGRGSPACRNRTFELDFSTGA